MTDQVLTDQEIVRLSLDLASVLGAEAFVKTVRDVEAAVLAKLVLLSDGSYAVFRDGKPLVTEREARIRERAAHKTGMMDALAPCSPPSWTDERYPLPACDKCGQVLP